LRFAASSATTAAASDVSSSALPSRTLRLQGRKHDLDRLETERVMNVLFQDRIDQLFQAVQENAARVSDQIAVLTQTVENCHDETQALR
jgi:hypothetical protein